MLLLGLQDTQRMNADKFFYKSTGNGAHMKHLAFINLLKSTNL